MSKGVIYTSVIAVLVAVLSVMPVFAGTLFTSGEHVSLEDRNGNAYVLGLNISVSEGVVGDIYAIGNTMHVDSAITGDIGFLGESLNVNADVDGDVRFVSTNLTVDGDISGEVMGLGELLVIKEGAVVSGDVNALATGIVVEGTVEGDIRASDTDYVIIHGTVNGTVHAGGVRSVVLEPGAAVTGTVFHTEGDALTVDSSAVHGGTEAVPESDIPDAGSFDFLVTLIAWLVSGLAAFFLFRKWWVGFIRMPFRSDSPAVNVLRGWIGTSAAGFGFLIFAPIVSVLLLFIPGLYPLVFPLLGAWLFLIMIAVFCVPVVVGTAAWALFAKRTVVTVQSTAVGAVLLFLLNQFMPFVGVIIVFLALLFLVGACLSRFVHQLR